jgi:hypothetical protein
MPKRVKALSPAGRAMEFDVLAAHDATEARHLIAQVGFPKAVMITIDAVSAYTGKPRARVIRELATAALCESLTEIDAKIKAALLKAGADQDFLEGGD